MPIDTPVEVLLVVNPILDEVAVHVGFAFRK